MHNSMPSKILAVSRSDVENLLAESVDDALRRERQTFDMLTGQLGQSIVLFGAGGLGRRILQGLRRHGIEPLAFCDNNPKLWNTHVEGLQVLAPEDAARRFGETATFVVTIWGALAKDRTSDRVRQLRSLGCASVLSCAPLLWKFPAGTLPHYGLDLPHLVIEQKEQVLQAFDLCADEESRREYLAQVRWRLYFDGDVLPAPGAGPIYFPPDVVRLGIDEVFVDCGAFDGDTVVLFLRKSGSKFRKIIALEPDPVNFARLERSISGLAEDVRARIHLQCAAVGSINRTVKFSAQGMPSSFVGAGDLEVQSLRLDDVLAGDPPTFIKMDIEGSEPDALLGAAALIRQSTPLLAISCYHAQNHLWTIPLLIRSLNSSYRFFLRPHDLEMWDLVCYAVPEGRSSHL
jgi:FkbM family methyltransferase